MPRVSILTSKCLPCQIVAQREDINEDMLSKLGIDYDPNEDIDEDFDDDEDETDAPAN